VHISSLTPAALDAATADALAALRNRAQAVDAPHLADVCGEALRLRLLHGWDGESTERVLLARDGTGRLLGCVEVDTPRQENRDLVWFDLLVDPPARRRGVGAGLLQAVAEVADEVGRGLLMTCAWHGSPGVAVLQRGGFTLASVAAQRRLYPQRLPRDGDAELLEGARAASAGYELVRVAGPLPEELLAPMLSTVDAINDAPLDDLELEDDAFTVDRLRRYDTAQRARRQRLYRLIARSRDDGTPAGHSVVAVDGDRPHLAEQHDTTVRPAHRGHRLGLRLKLEMLQWLREVEPQLTEVDTWNQESNVHMIAVNDAIGCVVVGREALLQRRVRQAPGADAALAAQARR
jgi:GNAT superfamily N-acetyltransferase